jgi:hypothetical protein
MLPNCFPLDVWCVLLRSYLVRAVANLQGRAVKPLVYAVYVTTVLARCLESRSNPAICYHFGRQANTSQYPSFHGCSWLFLRLVPYRFSCYHFAECFELQNAQWVSEGIHVGISDLYLRRPVRCQPPSCATWSAIRIQPVHFQQPSVSEPRPDL